MKVIEKLRISITVHRDNSEMGYGRELSHWAGGSNTGTRSWSPGFGSPSSRDMHRIILSGYPEEQPAKSLSMIEGRGEKLWFLPSLHL